MTETKKDSLRPSKAGWPTGYEVGTPVPIGRKALGTRVPELPPPTAEDVDTLLAAARRRVATGAAGRSVYADADQPDDAVFFDFGDVGVEPPKDEGGAGEDDEP